MQQFGEKKIRSYLINDLKTHELKERMNKNNFTKQLTLTIRFKSNFDCTNLNKRLQFSSELLQTNL